MAHNIPISSIHIPEERMRRSFDSNELAELSDSINRRGLYHPIVVAPDGDGYKLVAGERRLRAMRSLAELDIPIVHGTETLDVSYVPVTLLSELSPIQLREIELEENTVRVDLSWQDLVDARAALHELRKEQRPVQTVAQTAREIFGKSGGDFATAVKESLDLAPHLKDPEIAKAKSREEAMKILTKRREAEHRVKMAAGLQLKNTDHLLLSGEFFENILLIPDETITCIITDPPYGVNADNFGSQAGTPHNYNDSPSVVLKLLAQLSTESFRVASRQAHLYCFCAFDWYSDLADMMRLAGWQVWPRPIIWFKGAPNGMLPRPEHGPRYTYETVLYAIKGDKKILSVQPDVINIPADKEKIHAAQKPTAVYKDLLARSCLPGDTILDPFAGSGTVFKAAKELKLKAAGIEKDEQQIAHCKLAIGE